MNETVARNRPKVIQATITGKNQITIPAVVVRELQLEPGMRLEFELSGVRAVVVRPALTRAERVRQIEEKWQPLFPPGSDPIGDLIREREQEDEDMEQP
ncbi:MAG: AbrB/MazE/SpoVT family DNA-binding domain-containing protein [Candidatus Promineofilum sp.]|nr:AbrB/MazE/SpoVT family DNA-binding domain-containing protein [Promineifilum sp.]MCW5864902.1 hypothetical protein [Anaerolineae bacterium]